MVYILILVGLVLVFLYVELNTISVSVFKIKSNKAQKQLNKIKIVHLSDLHAKEFGKNNRRLIHKIKKLKPDFIIATGDMITSTDDNGNAFLNLALALSDKIPMYYIEGNHELTARYDTLNIKNGWYEEYLEALNDIGVQVLQNKTSHLILEGINIQIQGLTVPLGHYCAVPSHISQATDLSPLRQVADVLEKPSADTYNILLAHNPFLASMYAEHGVDLICCGHVHGGAVRLPFIGGLLSPERKLFPEYSAGLYEVKQSQMIVSRGLGRLRLFNRPEIVVIEIN